MTEDRFDDFLKRTLDELDPVPPTPREEIWARIERERSFAKTVRRTTSPRTWAGWGAGLAAMLAIGIGLGRMSTTPQPATDRPIAAAPASAPATAASASRMAYKLTVADYMTSAEALLTSFRTQPKGKSDPDLTKWANELLTNTRLLLDSPAADDPKTAQLLQDLELILAQIAHESASTKVEQDIIKDGMKKTAVLPRLRATAGT